MPKHITKNSQTLRTIAVEILSDIDRSDAYVDKSLQAYLEHSPFHQKDNNLLSELVRGCIRYKLPLDFIIVSKLKNQNEKLHSTVLNALRIAVYQLIFLSKIPPSAAVNESVEIVKQKKGVFLSKLTNAILRSIVSNLDELKLLLFDYSSREKISLHLSFPLWMVERCSSQFPEMDLVSFFHSFNQIPSITVRRNTLFFSEVLFEQCLTDLGIEYKKSIISTHSYRLHSIDNSTLKTLFEQKYCFVQDESASLVVELLSPTANETVIDICASPGGKSFSIADFQQNSGTIIANDLYETKTTALAENAQKLGYNSIQVSIKDLFTLQGDLFDKVLLDAPCSGLGVMRKKPDIKWRRSLASIYELQILQKKAIEHCASLVSIGGELVYSTCTYDVSENEEVVEWFLQRNPHFSLVPAEKFLPTEVCKNGYLRTFPHIHGCDGAFGAKLKRNS